MQIRFLSRLFRTAQESETKPASREPNQKQVNVKASQTRDSFEPASRNSFFSGKTLPASDLKQEQNASQEKKPEASQRNSFFSGKFLSATDLQQEQNYSRDKKSGPLVEFEAGEARSPYVIGNLWNSGDKPPATEKKESDSDDDNS